MAAVAGAATSTPAQGPDRIPALASFAIPRAATRGAIIARQTMSTRPSTSGPIRTARWRGRACRAGGRDSAAVRSGHDDHDDAGGASERNDRGAWRARALATSRRHPGRASSGGLAFQSRCQPNALKNLAIEVRPHDVAVTLGDFVRPGWRGVWTPALAAIYDERGRLVDRAARSERHFGGPSSRSTGTSSTSSPSPATRSGTISRSRSCSNAGRRTHRRGGLRRRPGAQGSTPASAPDVADPFASARAFSSTPTVASCGTTTPPSRSAAWATGANLCLESEVVGGDPLLYPAQGLSAPRTAEDRSSRFPTLVWIELDDMSVVPAIRRDG